MGFTFDPTKVATEIANCTAVVTEYIPSFEAGIFGDKTEAKYTEFLAKLKSAGIDKVLAEKQTQVDAFIAVKNASK